ncbi:hypothetical protein AKO1_008351 [Acrasis kona]|uniref:CID domain-containing protein n=1 Tax=Acrasis kona TaxID=1008807 RepID=A0AAW2YNJ6_9EUKA
MQDHEQVLVVKTQDHGQVLVGKLNSMNNSQQSIQSISYWVMFNRKKAKESVAVWKKEIVDAKPSRRLLYFYLANDVIQNSKKKTNEFVDNFQAVMPEVLQLTHSDLSPKDKQSIVRIINIWDERKIYTSAFCQSCKGIVGQPTPKPKTSPHKRAHVESTPMLSPNLSAGFIVTLSDLDDIVNSNNQQDKSYKSATGRHKEEFVNIMDEASRVEPILGTLSLEDLKKTQNEYARYSRKFVELKSALETENKKRREWIKIMQDEISQQSAVCDQFDTIIKEWDSNTVYVQRYLTSVEIHINNKKLQDDGAPHVGTLHPSGSGDGGYYFCTDDDEDHDFNKKRIAELISPDLKRQKVEHHSESMDNNNHQDYLSSLSSPGSNHDPSFTLLMNTTNNAFRLGDEDNFTNQFLYDDQD